MAVLQVLNVTLNGIHTFSFVYVRSTPIQSESLWLASLHRKQQRLEQ